MMGQQKNTSITPGRAYPQPGATVTGLQFATRICVVKKERKNTPTHFPKRY